MSRSIDFHNFLFEITTRILYPLEDIIALLVHPIYSGKGQNRLATSSSPMTWRPVWWSQLVLMVLDAPTKACYAAVGGGGGASDKAGHDITMHSVTIIASLIETEAPRKSRNQGTVGSRLALHVTAS